jgi:hypothetical protein
MALEEDIAELIKDNRANDARVKDIAEYIRSEFSYFEVSTGVPGAAAADEEIAEGLTVTRNGNGEIIAYEVTLTID